jgi:hypothetical protein
LIFCASGFSLWGTEPGEANNDDESLLQDQLALLEDTLKITVQAARDAMKGHGEMAKTIVWGLGQAIHEEGKWELYVNEFDRIQTTCLKYAAEIAALRQLAVAIRDAALYGFQEPTYLPDGDITDPITEAWNAFSIALHYPSGMNQR